MISFLLTFSLFITTTQADTTPPHITSLKLNNPVVSAGENLEIEFTATDNESGISNYSSVTIYLGMIIQNIFKHSDSYNRDLIALENSRYRTKNLIVNPWAVRTQDKFQIEQFYLYDQAGNYTVLFTYSASDTYYFNEKGEQTDFEILRFEVKENPLGDNVGPEILSFTADKKIYAPNEKIQINYTARDNISGIAIGCCAGMNTSPHIFHNSQNINLHTKEIGKESYQLSPIKIPADAQDGSFTFTTFGVYDRAGAAGSLYQAQPTDEFYSTNNGELTTIPVVQIQIRTKK